MKLTQRQIEVLSHVKMFGPVGSGYDKSVLLALERKGLVVKHQFSEGQNIYYTWSAKQ
jgi:single-stranded DNA-specific DHH superfamily exonuclease